MEREKERKQEREAQLKQLLNWVDRRVKSGKLDEKVSINTDVSTVKRERCRRCEKEETS